nr:MAG TPA: hypothetical protein [Caudoviricetes sp.]
MQEILSTFHECGTLVVRTLGSPFGQPGCPHFI